MPSQKPAGLGSFPLEYAALGLLIDEPRHGYLLYRDFSREFHLIWKAGQANFYLALTSLEQRGFVTVTTEEQEGNPPRKVYHATEAGREAFVAWLNTPVASMRAFRVEFMARLRFFKLLGLPGAAALIERQVALFERLLAEWESPPVTKDSEDPIPAMVADFRRRQARTSIAWLLAWQAYFIEDSQPR